MLIQLQKHRTIPGKKRGVTLIEIMVACGLLTMVFLAVAFIQVFTMRQTRVLATDARTLHRAHLVLDRVRFKLMMARVGTLNVLDNGRVLEFNDPNLPPGTISMFKFYDRTAEEGKRNRVFYYEDKSSIASAPGQGIGLIDDVRFVPLGPGNAVRVSITTIQEYAWKLDRPFTLSAEVTLRN
jgi:hypothetical protein